ncbi:hypothetical protein MNAN1_003456 [Malassezia nana]|uniref:Peroxisomal membrane protein PEX14-like KPWE domain-containing protein n=1 Tax=Malassezia nana TaxID=180528 RepID=A0AAF0EPU0_9BASI|nr:hypothetical protein MNAN1_003456 [Malassezia nana]
MALPAEVEYDHEFQDGIRAIVSQLQAQGASEAQIKDTVQQATEYYQQRNRASEQEQHKEELSVNEEPETAVKEPERGEPYPASFTAIVEMLTTGREDQIPGIREIPLKINEQPPSESKMTRPRKPWE